MGMQGDLQIKWSNLWLAIQTFIASYSLMSIYFERSSCYWVHWREIAPYFEAHSIYLLPHFKWPSRCRPKILLLLRYYDAGQYCTRTIHVLAFRKWTHKEYNNAVFVAFVEIGFYVWNCVCISICVCIWVWHMVSVFCAGHCVCVCVWHMGVSVLYRALCLCLCLRVAYGCHRRYWSIAVGQSKLIGRRDATRALR